MKKSLSVLEIISGASAVIDGGEELIGLAGGRSDGGGPVYITAGEEGMSLAALFIVMPREWFHIINELRKRRPMEVGEITDVNEVSTDLKW